MNFSGKKLDWGRLKLECNRVLSSGIEWWGWEIYISWVVFIGKVLSRCWEENLNIDVVVNCV